MKLVIMAGGIGSKLWPVSRLDTPKQFIKIVGGKTLFQMNVEALLLKYTPEDIFVSTNKEYVKFIKEQAPLIPEANYIIEPKLQKNTGPASCYAMLKVAKKYPDEVVMFYVQPVVIREPNEKYVDMIDGIEDIVKRHGVFVTGGKYPKVIDVGSDALEIGNKLDAKNGLELYKVNKFVHIVDERKSYNEAKNLYQNKQLIIHCNHYTWTPNKFFESIKKYKPEWYIILKEIEEVLDTDNEYEKVAEIYKKFEEGRIEIVTEKIFNSGEGVVVVLPFKWEHITTWDNVYQYKKLKGDSTITYDTVEIDSKDNLVLDQEGKLIALLGIEGLVVINTKDAVLICPREKIDKVKALYEKLEEGKNKKFL